MSSTTDKFNGKTKQVVGKVTDNQSLKTKGEAQESKGRIKDKLKDIGEKVTEKIETSIKKIDK